MGERIGGCSYSGFVGENIAVFIQVIAVFVRPYPAVKGIAHSLRLRDCVVSTVLCVYRLNAVAALAQIKADKVIVAVIIKLELG